nr:HtaA domain-containing protein [Janibacter cremeus]
MWSAKAWVRRICLVLATPFALVLLGTGTVYADSSSSPASPSRQCRAQGTDLTWGFKESFRSYISSSIADGDWSTSGDATYATPHFIWAKGKGAFESGSGTGSVAFEGSITFTGHDGALGVTMSDPRVRVDGESAVLVLDIVSGTMEAAMAGEDDTTTQSDVPFVTLDLSDAEVDTASGQTTITVTDAPTTLTTKGEEAFSNYPPGTAFDPISLTITTDSQCRPEMAAAASSDPTESDDDGMALAVVGGAGLAVCAGAATLVLRRRRHAA